MDWQLAAKLLKSAKERRDNYLICFKQLPTSDAYGNSDYECPLCSDGLFGQSIVSRIGTYSGGYVMVCPTCAAISGPWITGDFGW